MRRILLSSATVLAMGLASTALYAQGAPAGAPPGGAPPAPTLSHNPADAPAGMYETDPTHTSVLSVYFHQGTSNLTYRFDKVDATIDYNPQKPETSKVNATIDMTSLDTGSEEINKHFLTERLTESSKYPTITFASTAINKGDGKVGTMTGNLTMYGQTHPVTLDVTFNGTRVGMGKRQVLGFSAKAAIDLKQWGVSMGPPPLNVNIVIEAEFQQKK